MHSRCLITSRQALFRVFVCPCLSTHQLAPPGIGQRLPPKPNHNQQKRHLYKYARVAPTKPLSYHSPNHPLDEQIGTLTAHLVSADGKLQPPSSLNSLIRTIDRATEHLRKVGDGPDGVPIVKVYTKEALREEARAKLGVKERKTDEDLTKQVELNWAITGNDLGYRLTWIEGFLREGRRVEVLIAPKRGGRKASKEEIVGLLEEIREKVKEVEGAEEWKVMEGVPGGQVVLFFQSQEERRRIKEMEKEKAREGRAEKLERKERAKREEKEKLERRLERKREREEREAKSKIMPL